VIAVNPDRRPGRLLIRADDPSLTPYAGLAISGELVRNLRVVELIDAELQAAERVRPVKQRRRGLSPGELTVAIAEAQLVGAECFDDIELDCHKVCVRRERMESHAFNTRQEVLIRASFL
jgi:hypothetical protein